MLHHTVVPTMMIHRIMPPPAPARRISPIQLAQRALQPNGRNAVSLARYGATATAGVFPPNASTPFPKTKSGSATANSASAVDGLDVQKLTTWRSDCIDACVSAVPRGPTPFPPSAQGVVMLGGERPLPAYAQALAERAPDVPRPPAAETVPYERRFLLGRESVRLKRLPTTSLCATPAAPTIAVSQPQPQPPANRIIYVKDLPAAQREAGEPTSLSGILSCSSERSSTSQPPSPSPSPSPSRLAAASAGARWAPPPQAVPMAQRKIDRGYEPHYVMGRETVQLKRY
jgi:hypothetical protein